MTDEEITVTIAEKVMGWPRLPDEKECSDCWYYNSERAVCVNSSDLSCGKEGVKWRAKDRPLFFDPLASDADCMMMWDKFSAYVFTELPAKDAKLIFDHLSHVFFVLTGGKRRREVCLCVVKAVGG